METLRYHLYPAVAFVAIILAVIGAVAGLGPMSAEACERSALENRSICQGD